MPSLTAYMKLRKDTGMSQKSREQSQAALLGQWYGVHVVLAQGETVAMGRVISAGDWYYTIADIAVLPPHQGQGIGYAVMERIMAEIDERALPEPYVTLAASASGERLYRKFGFGVPGSVAMVRSQGRS